MVAQREERKKKLIQTGPTFFLLCLMSNQRRGFVCIRRARQMALFTNKLLVEQLIVCALLEKNVKVTE